MDLILKSLYFILPAYFANAASSLSSKLKWLPQPLDNGKKMGANDILGAGKTCQGTIIGLIVGVLTVGLQALLYSLPFFQKISLINYQQSNWLILGILAASGSVGGDLLASFLKRRFNIKRGQPALFLDQWDFIIGFFLLTSVIIRVPSAVMIIALLLTIIIHPLTNIIAYFLKIKNVWW